MSQFTIWMSFERSDHFFEKVSRHAVVTCRNVNIFTLRLPKTLVPGRIRPFARPLCDAQTLVLASDILDELPRTVIGVTVVDKQFPVLESLLKNAVKPFLQKRKCIQVW